MNLLRSKHVRMCIYRYIYIYFFYFYMHICMHTPLLLSRYSYFMVFHSMVFPKFDLLKQQGSLWAGRLPPPKKWLPCRPTCHRYDRLLSLYGSPVEVLQCCCSWSFGSRWLGFAGSNHCQLFTSHSSFMKKFGLTVCLAATYQFWSLVVWPDWWHLSGPHVPISGKVICWFVQGIMTWLLVKTLYPWGTDKQKE